MKSIPLTQGLVALVDDEDYAQVCEFKWYAARYKHLVYAQREIRRPDGSRTTLKLHNVIMPPKGGLRADHRDGNGLNCRKNNLRYASNLQNGSNKRKTTSKRTSLFKGVYWASDRNKWRAAIRVSGKLINLGQFDSEADAARYYDEAAKNYFGEFAHLNLPGDGFNDI